MNNNTNSNKDLKDLAIEGKLPLKAVGIENLKEDNPKHMPPNRYLFPWYARRPTPAARLAVLASVLPSGASSDDILDLMQIKPRSGIDIPLEEYVINKKSTEGERSGTLGEHYGYPRPFESSPIESNNKSFIQNCVIFGMEIFQQSWIQLLAQVLFPRILAVWSSNKSKRTQSSAFCNAEGGP